MEQSRMYVPDGTDRVMVASFLDIPREGSELANLPAHLTYVSWFNLPHHQREEFYAHMDDIIEQNRAPKIMGGSQTLFTDTNTAEYSLEQGEEVRLDNLTIVRRDKNIGRKVVERVLNWRRND